jgi:molybdopterin-binding protein
MRASTDIPFRRNSSCGDSLLDRGTRETNPCQVRVHALKTGGSIRISGLDSAFVPHYRIAQAASLLGVSDDTVRRWLDSGRLRASGASGPTTIDGAELAAHAQEIATAPELGRPVAESARNRFTGLVTRVTKDSVMAQVDLQCGPFRVVSLMSAEAATELQLEPGVLAVASVKSTHVVVEIPADR